MFISSSQVPITQELALGIVKSIKNIIISDLKLTLETEICVFLI